MSAGRFPALARLLLIMTAMALAGAGIMALRILERDQLWTDRTDWLMALGAFGNALAILPPFFAPALLTWRGLAWARPLGRAPRLLAGVLFALGLLAIMAGGFFLYGFFIAGMNDLNPDRPIISFIFAIAQTMALFLYSASFYLLPWPLPVLTGLAVAILTIAAPPAQKVELSGDGV